MQIIMPTDKWGNATWILFHTIAEQISEPAFVKNKNQLITFIKTTCKNLPCPVCAASATNILDKAYLHLIQTKADFVSFLGQFHNIVNIKLDKKMIAYDTVKNKFKNAKLDICIGKFMTLFGMSYGNMKALTQTFHRQNLIKSQRQFLYSLLPECSRGSN